jgi:SAM-dependent MidA family methyltransferase
MKKEKENSNNQQKSALNIANFSAVELIKNKLFESIPNISNEIIDAIHISQEMEKQKTIDFAKKTIDFADWLDKLTPSQRVSVWSKNGESKGLFNMDNEQLFEKYNETFKNTKE